MMKLFAILTALMMGQGVAFAQCEQPNGNDQIDDSNAIECLLNQGGTVVLNADVTYGYYIGQTVDTLDERRNVHEHEPIWLPGSAVGYAESQWADLRG